MKYFRVCVFLFAFLCGAESVWAGVSRITTDEDDSGCFVRLVLDKEYEYRTFTLKNPDRLVVDVLQKSQDRAVPDSMKCPMIKSVRHSWFDKTRYRFVFDMDAPLAIISHSIDKNRISLVVGNAANKPKEIVQAPEKEAPVKKIAPKKNVAVPIIVIDPGHGGVDPGAIGANGLQEKDIVLDFAHALRQSLQISGKYKVRLTRQGDVYVKLGERVQKASELEADLFISLHADATPERNARGLSVYTLSEKAADNLSESIVNDSGSGDFISGIDLTGKSKEVAGILIDLAERENLNRSAEFANMVIGSMNERKVKLINNTHRFAGYVVLKSPEVPAVLVELGFLSSPEDEKKLRSPTYMKTVVGGIQKSIDSYFAKNPVYGD